MIFCTLFDSNYLDKGFVMFNSLKRLNVDFKLYVLAMDEVCYKVLSDEKDNNVNGKELIPVSLDEFLSFEINSDIKPLRHKRFWAEFCWTCTSYLIDYVLTVKKEKICTYIDADLYFYNNPEILIDEMQDKTVQIVPHRFTNSEFDKMAEQHSGTYCVEFNTFKNARNSLELLRWWKAQCFKECSVKSSEKAFGDQKYLNGWEKKDFVSVLENLGGGVAPWNIRQYKMCDKDNLILEEKKTVKKFELVFYHFQHITYITPHKININVYNAYQSGVDSRIIKAVYIPYLKELDHAKNILNEKYGIYPILYEHPALEGTIKKRTFLDRLKALPKNLCTKIPTWIKFKISQRKNIIEI